MRGSQSRPDGGAEAREIEVPLALASEEERLRKKSFEMLEPHELQQILRLMAAVSLATWTCAGRCARAFAPAATR